MTKITPKQLQVANAERNVACCHGRLKHVLAVWCCLLLRVPCWLDEADKISYPQSVHRIQQQKGLTHFFLVNDKCTIIFAVLPRVWAYAVFPRRLCLPYATLLKWVRPLLCAKLICLRVVTVRMNGETQHGRGMVAKSCKVYSRATIDMTLYAPPRVVAVQRS